MPVASLLQWAVGGQESPVQIEVPGDLGSQGLDAKDFGGIVAAEVKVEAPLLGKVEVPLLEFARDEGIDAVCRHVGNAGVATAREQADGLGLSRAAFNGREGVGEEGLEAFTEGLTAEAGVVHAGGDRVALVGQPPAGDFQLELAGKDGVIADFRVAIQGQVGAVNGEVVGKEQFEFAAQGPDAGHQRRPAHAMVNDEKIDPGGGGGLKGLNPRIYRRANLGDFARVLKLQAIFSPREVRDRSAAHAFIAKCNDIFQFCHFCKMSDRPGGRQVCCWPARGDSVFSWLIMREFRGILLDMDGTLLDSERACLRAYQEAAQEHGIELPTALFISMIGYRSDIGYRLLREGLPGNAPVEAIIASAQRRYHAMIEGPGIPARAGVVPLLEWVQHVGLPCAVATSSRTDAAEQKLTRAGLRGFVGPVIGGEQVAHSKPAPDIYEKAAAELGLRPEHCLAVEDSPTGLQSAAAAGCQAFLVPDLAPSPPEIAALAHEVFADMAALHEALQQAQLLTL